MAETISPNEQCIHANQRYVEGVWVCKLCNSEVDLEPTAAEDYASIRFSGLGAFKQFRDFGKTEREMTRDNLERFRKEKGYDPVREDGKDRWI